MRTSPLIYGTAWKEDDTARCVTDALRAGFRAIDTANQRKHYVEADVGAALRAAYDEGLVRRDGLWLQSKFTFRRGQDDRLPYDPRAPLATQVVQSLESSLQHLGAEALDSYLLHGPSQRPGLGQADWEVWRAMEALHERGVVRAIGVSNVDAAQLRELIGGARVAPSWVQHRCYASQGWGSAVRAVCREHGVGYQGFSLLTANRDALRSRALRAAAERVGRTPAQVVFRFARALGMWPLTGTTDPRHMREDLSLDFELTAEELTAIEQVGV